MKKILCLLCILMATHWLPAQADSAAVKNKVRVRHELGMSLYAMSVKSGDYYSSYRNQLHNYVLNGLYYRYYFGKSAFRASASYLYKLVNLKQRYYGYTVPSSKTLQVAAGYQRFLGKGRLRRYVMADLSYEFVSDVRTGSDCGNGFLPFESYYGYYSSNSSVGSVSPGLGLRLHLGKNVMLSVESALQFYYAVENHSYRSVGINARPLQCLLGFSF